MTVSARAFTEAMSRIPAPVTVATTTARDGRSWGFTASSFCSLSLDPPLVLLCLARDAGSHPAFTRAGVFLVNVLAAEHAHLARHFATRDSEKVAAGGFTPCEKGLPGLPEAAARIACTTYDVLAGGDHSIIVGLVEATHIGDRPPLAYCDRTFTRPVPVPAAMTTGAAPRKEQHAPHP